MTRVEAGANFAAMNEELNSIRMRAERAGKHISGAERLVAPEQVADIAVEMVQRALQHPRGPVEKISIHVENLDSPQIVSGRLPDLYDNRVDNWRQGRALAEELLLKAGVAQQAARIAMQTLAAGAAPGGESMRGAMLIDAASGQRLEPDFSRGVRVSRMDLTLAAREQLLQELEQKGLNNLHVVEALTLAAKVLAAPGMIAELCWSDDPDYVAGYVAAAGCYQRINLMKPAGEERGGRAFFVRCPDQPAELINWLQRQPFLVERIGRIRAPRH